MIPPWSAVVETEWFRRAAPGVLSLEETDQLIVFLAVSPRAGVVVPGAGGIRKLRWRAKGKGKKGGARVIYYFRNVTMPLYLLTVFSKDGRADLTESERRIFRNFVEHL